MAICEKCNRPKRTTRIIQADSRMLSQVLQNERMVGITSPPYQDMDVVSSLKPVSSNKDKKLNEIQNLELKRYSSNPSNIGNLKDKKLVGITSPPFEESVANVDRPSKEEGQKWHEMVAKRKLYGHYSNNQNNLGNQQGESYLQAMLKVYSESAKSGISPLVTVTKNPTRAGKLRRLDLDTARLLQMAGYRIVDYHRAKLWEEKKQATLTGNIRKEQKGRLSFFKRLSVQKGNKAAMWEDVIIAVL